MDDNFLKVCEHLEQLEKDAIESINNNINVTRYWILSREAAHTLYTLAREREPKTILELGGSIGYSTIHLALAAKELGGKVYTVEKDWKKIAIAKETFTTSGLQEYIHLYEERIEEVLAKWDMPIDFLFLDAGKKDYLPQLKALEPFLTKGAVVVADNITNQKELVGEYVTYVTTDPKYQTQFIETNNGFLVSIKLI